MKDMTSTVINVKESSSERGGEMPIVEVEETQQEEVKAPDLEMNVFSDIKDIEKFLRVANIGKTVDIYMMSQGVKLSSNIIPMTAIHDATKSDNSRLELINLLYEYLTPNSKELFGNSLNSFLSATSYYDIEHFVYPQIQSWEEDKFELTCVNEKCGRSIKFEKKINELLHADDEVLDRIEAIKHGEDLLVISAGEPFVLDNEITVKFSVPSLEKHRYLNNLDLPLIMYWKLLHIESIIFKLDGKDNLIPLNRETVKAIASIFDTRKTSKLDSEIAKRFGKYELTFTANIKCPHCGTINTVVKSDLLNELALQVLS